MKKVLIICSVMAGMIISTTGLSQVVITPINQPVYRFSPEELLNIILVNPGSVPLEGVLEVKVEDNFHTNVIRLTTVPFSLNPGSNMIRNRKILFQSEFGSGRKSSVFRETGTLEYGEYIFCYTFRDLKGQILGLSCNEEKITPSAPPRLSTPSHQEVIKVTTPLLTWIPPFPLISGQQLFYSIKVVEKKKEQNSREAISSNNPVLQTRDIKTTFINYSIASRKPLEIGKIYTWQVEAYTADYYLGVTEIWDFTIDDDSEAERMMVTDDSYRMINNIPFGEYYLTPDGVLRFAYNNLLRETELNYNILSEEDFSDDYSLPSVALQPGMNKINLDLSAVLDTDEKYLLIITDKNLRKYWIEFLYNPE